MAVYSEIQEEVYKPSVYTLYMQYFKTVVDLFLWVLENLLYSLAYIDIKLAICFSPNWRLNNCKLYPGIQGLLIFSSVPNLIITIYY
jgi:hypothetical protein